MAVLFMGSGLDALNNSGLNEQEISAPAFTSFMDSSFVRTAVRIGAFSGWAETPEWTAVQELWVHYYVSCDSRTSDYLALMDGSTAVFKMHTASGTMRLSYLSAPATWTQVGSAFTVPDNCYLDIYFKSGASGEVGVYVNGVEQMTASASMTFAEDVTKARWTYVDNVYHNISAIAVAEEPTIGWRVNQGYPSGNGANTAWTGDYTSVDEAALSTADYIYSGTANQVETFTHTLVAAMTGYVPRAVAVAARSRRGSSGPQSLQLALRSGSTDYFSSSHSPGLGFGAEVNVWNTNPDTSADWTSSQIASLQPGVKSIA